MKSGETLCHPGRLHKAKGLCNSCYQKERRKYNPEKYLGYDKKKYKKHRKTILESRKKFQEENKERIKKRRQERWAREGEKCCEIKRDWVFRNKEKVMLIEARKRAKKAGLECTISEEDIFIPDTCPYIGISLYFAKGLRTEHSPTLDRVDVSKGYTPSNIKVVSYRANRIKNDGTIEELESIARAVRRHLDEQKTPIPTVE